MPSKIVRVLIDFDGEYTFRSWENDFVVAHKASGRTDLERFRSLCPSWVFEADNKEKGGQ